MVCIVHGVAKSRTQPSDFHFQFLSGSRRLIWLLSTAKSFNSIGGKGLRQSLKLCCLESWAAADGQPSGAGKGGKRLRQQRGVCSRQTGLATCIVPPEGEKIFCVGGDPVCNVHLDWATTTALPLGKFSCQSTAMRSTKFYTYSLYAEEGSFNTQSRSYFHIRKFLLL